MAAGPALGGLQSTPSNGLPGKKIRIKFQPSRAAGRRWSLRGSPEPEVAQVSRWPADCRWRRWCAGCRRIGGRKLFRGGIDDGPIGNIAHWFQSWQLRSRSPGARRLEPQGPWFDSTRCSLFTAASCGMVGSHPADHFSLL